MISIFAGLLSFLSPCVLPLVPAYLGYLSGHAVGMGDIGTKEGR
ncbi:MAG: cytochrome c biogenesis protein CcdA [Anaerolineales bacterium]